MSDVATLSYTLPVEGVSHAGDRAQPRLVSRVAQPSKASAATNEYAGRAFDHHFAKLRAVIEDSSFWPEGAEKPSESAAAWALAMLEQLVRDRVQPTRVVASAEGGVAICFVNGNKYADLEFLNSGEILGVVSNRRDKPVAWAIDQSSAEMAQASARVRDFIYPPNTASDDTRQSRPR